jgi:hypothetical protein
VKPALSPGIFPALRIFSHLASAISIEAVKPIAPVTLRAWHVSRRWKGHHANRPAAVSSGARDRPVLHRINRPNP